MADSKQTDQKAQAAQQQADQEAAKELQEPERANQAAARAPALDFDIEEMRRGADDPTSQRAPAWVHALTTEYAGYINVGRPERAEQVEDELRKLGYSTEGIRLADSPSLPRRVAEEEDARGPAERRKKAAEREEFVKVTGRRVPDRQTTAGTKGTGKEADKIHVDS
jgi:hypothetical protein